MEAWHRPRAPEDADDERAPAGQPRLLVFGADPLRAAELVVAVEESARAEISAEVLGRGVDLPAGAFHAVRASLAEAQS